LVISAAARNNVPAVYADSVFARDGGLLSYGGDTVDNSRRAATYVDRILRGEKPGDLRVQLPTKFEMVVNRKTAKALGLAIPPSIMLRADEVSSKSSGRSLLHCSRGPLLALTPNCCTAQNSDALAGIADVPMARRGLRSAGL
jgi:hypothetical protein